MDAVETWLPYGKAACKACASSTTVDGDGKKLILCQAHALELETMVEAHPERRVKYNYRVDQFFYTEGVEASRDDNGAPLGDLDPRGLLFARLTHVTVDRPYPLGVKQMLALLKLRGNYDERVRKRLHIPAGAFEKELFRERG